MTDPTLASDVPTATREAWAGLVDKVLKGADFERKLVGRTYDGLRIEPLYPKAEGGAVLGRAAPGPWRVSQRAEHPDAATANALALADLEGGADQLTLVMAGAPMGRGFGLAPDDLDLALDGVMLDLIHVRVEGHDEAALALLALAQRRGHEPDILDIDLGLDPVGLFARRGGAAPDNPDLARVVDDVGALGFNGRIAIADGRPYHEAGAGEAQELAAIVATAVSYLRQFEGAGLTLERARDALSFLAVADADEFLTVAKLRALRLLWRRVESACAMEPRPIRLHAETAWRMTTRVDPWVNILRGTMAAFAAGIGGADSVTVLPFTAALGLPDAFARRIARNTQLILLEEANLWRVTDPVAGSGGFEALTAELAEVAWALFQDIEREGGIVASLGAGALQRRIAETRMKRERAVATRRDPLTGASEFPNIYEAPISVLMPSPPRQETESALPSRRSAEPFERLREQSDEILATTGARPRVFLANLGPLAAFSARATFAKNAFEAGGIEAIDNDGFASIEDLTAAFETSGAALACICSSDEIYATQGVPAAIALHTAGACAYLAGRPGETETELKAAGIAGFVHVGCDLLGLLRHAYEPA